ncbi:uncharacterized protein A4U43_C02F7730 [Asparagus officinalis]|uniref:Clp R domain-containing protein n=1 Tax=Asparagus officinalis TaxID=4686 RepID=A0A5P1FGR7_ASPOF|nr:protein SMAX1-LIKE 3 [Asparagus officinalis]ONK77548.1 uncharacterized protein A4U43_C02F7730 [Asparagus officinalis]
MRAGGCTIYQSLTPEAAAIIEQAIALARHRGHAQVTPLHVASTMLSSSTTLFRSACLKSHSHPLQCKALELCFNVALNRLPASSSPILIGLHDSNRHPLSLSNALIAAFKRAQAHQRRGSIESQQQPVLNIKIELEQLIISILDDPRVSRVMREAGFSSSHVKANVEKNSNPNPSSSKPKEPIKPIRIPSPVMTVIETLASGHHKSVVVVDECLASIEGVVRGVMDRVDKGEVPEILKRLQFITFPLFSFRNLRGEEVEHKVRELKCLMRSCCVGRGVVLYLGDLQWAAEYRATALEENGRGYYCPVEHIIMEIRSLVCGGFGGESGLIGGRFWVMGIATYKTYVKCRVGSPSLEAVLGLHPITIPATSLELSLNSDRDSKSLSKSKRSGDGLSWHSLLEDGAGNQLAYCGDCSIKFENEALSLPKISSRSQGSMITSNLPSWLQLYKEENKRSTSNHKESKWSSICRTTHKHQHHSSEITLHFSSLSPSSSSISSHDQPFLSLQYQSKHQQKEDPNRNPNSTSSSDTMEMERLSKFKELNAENLKILSNTLEKNVPSQKAIIPEIASTILQCRSGMMIRKERSKSSKRKEDTWLLFQGRDVEGKEKIARELAGLVFGSYANLVSIELCSYSLTKSGSTEDFKNKRSRSEASHSYLERLFEAVCQNPHRVFLVEDIEQVDAYSQVGIKTAIQTGKIRSSNGNEVSMSDAIVILCCESFDSGSRACSPSIKQKLDSEDINVQESEKEMESSSCLDLNLCVVDEDLEDNSFGDTGLLETVDRVFFLNDHNDLGS